MKRISPISIVLAFFALGLFSADSALCRAESHSLLLQQMPSQGGIVSPEIGVHHYSSDESQVTLIAVPQPGYQFVYWLGDVLDPTANKTTALLNESKVIVAVFQRVEEGQLIVGQNVPTGGGGGGGSFSSGSPISPAVNRTRGGGGYSSGGGGASTPTPPTTEGDDNDPPDDPPGTPEPATGLMLTLGAAALLRKRKAAKAS